MANPTITKQQMLNLLDKLSSDDAFRSRFQQDPKAGLIAVGVAQAHVATFPADKLGSGQLADKSVFAAERQRVAASVAADCLCMVVPGPGWKGGGGGGHHGRP